LYGKFQAGHQIFIIKVQNNQVQGNNFRGGRLKNKWLSGQPSGKILKILRYRRKWVSLDFFYEMAARALKFISPFIKHL